jgi:hypothetical protein
MKYTFKDIKDKSKEGVHKEVEEGLAIIAVYFQESLGVNVEVFEEWIEKLPTNADIINFYMNFRNEHPKLFDK